MAEEVASLFVSLNASVTGFLTSMASAEKGALGMEGAVGKGVAGLAKLGVGSIAVAAIVGATAVKMAMDYDTSMTKVQALTGATTAEMAQLNAGVMKLAPQVGKGPKELADALYFIESAGFHGAKALDVLAYSAKASAAGLGQTKTVADAVTSAMTAYANKGLDARHSTDALVAAVTQGKVPADSLAAALGRVIGSSAALNVSFPEVLANIATLTRTGMSASQAATSVQSIETALLRMLNPSKSVKAALDALGLSGTQLAHDLGSKGLYATLTEIITATHGNNDALVKLFPNVRALRDVLGTAGVQGQNYAEILRQIQGASNGAGTTQTAFQITQQNFTQQLKQLQAQMSVWLIQLGNFLIPYLQQAIRWVQEFTTWLGKHKEVALALALVVGTVLVAALVAATAAAIAFTVSLVTNPVFLVVAAIALLVAGVVMLWRHWDEVWKWIMNHKAYALILAVLFPMIAAVVALVGIAKWLYTNWDQIWKQVTDTTRAAVNWIVGAWNDLWDIGKTVVNGIVAAWNWLTTAFGAVLSFFAGLPDRILGFLVSIPTRLAQLAGLMIGMFVASIITAAYGIWKFFTELLPKIISLIPNAAGWLLKTGFDLVVGLVNGIITSAVALWGFFTSLPGRILGFVASAGSWLINTGIMLLVGLVNGTISGAGGLWSFLTGLPGRIMSFLSGAAGWLYNVGKQIIQGLINGVASMGSSFASSLGNTIVNNLPGPLKGTAKSILGLASGTKSAPGGMAWVGEQGPELVQLPRGSKVYPAGQSRMMGGGAGGGNTFYNTFTTNADAAQIAREIAWQLKTGS